MADMLVGLTEIVVRFEQVRLQPRRLSKVRDGFIYRVSTSRTPRRLCISHVDGLFLNVLRYSVSALAYCRL